MATPMHKRKPARRAIIGIRALVNPPHRTIVPKGMSAGEDTKRLYVFFVGRCRDGEAFITNTTFHIELGEEVALAREVR